MVFVGELLHEFMIKIQIDTSAFILTSTAWTRKSSRSSPNQPMFSSLTWIIVHRYHQFVYKQYAPFQKRHFTSRVKLMYTTDSVHNLIDPFSCGVPTTKHIRCRDDMTNATIQKAGCVLWECDRQRTYLLDSLAE